MTTKPRKTEVQVDDEWIDVTEHVAEPVTVERGAKSEPEQVSIDGMTADAVLLMLRALRKTGGPVILTATTAKPNDQVVVDGHAYSGRREGSGWQFDARSLDMACRVAGWSKVEHVEPGKVRLS